MYKIAVSPEQLEVFAGKIEGFKKAIMSECEYLQQQTDAIRPFVDETTGLALLRPVKDIVGIITEKEDSLKELINKAYAYAGVVRNIERKIDADIEQQNTPKEEIRSMVSKRSSDSLHTTTLNLCACNNALIRDGRGMQMIDISHIQVEGISDDHFWTHHGRSEAEWEKGMHEFTDMMQNFSEGMSIEQCYETYPGAAGMVFGSQTIQLSNNLEGELVITNGRHRIAMAQKLGITHLPAIVY